MEDTTVLLIVLSLVVLGGIGPEVIRLVRGKRTQRRHDRERVEE
jgi:hypothetical protein